MTVSTPSALAAGSIARTERPQPRYLVHAQLPFAALVGVTTTLAISMDRFNSSTVALALGLTLAIAATVLAFVLPWRRLGSSWLALVAIADIVVVALYSDALYTVLPGVVILIVFPVLWLCYAFRWPLLLLGIVGAFVVTLFPFARSGTFPANETDWANVLLLPVATSLLAVAVHVAVLHLREQQRRIAAITLELTDREAMTRAVLDTVDAGITLYDPDGVVLLTNALASPRLLSDAAATQLADEADVFESDRTTPIPLEDQIVARAARGELVTRRTFWVSAGQQQRAVDATSQYARRASGELIGTVVATHDVTQLAEAIRSRDEFLTTISHELKTPMTSILGYLEILEDRPDLADVGLAHEFDVIQRNSLRLHSLISALITTAQQQVSVDRRPYDVAKLVENAVNAARLAADQAQVNLVSTSIVDTIAEVDADHISAALNALIANAIVFNRPNGTVSVDLTRDGANAVVRVIDTGIGISGSDLPRIFDRFFRASNVKRNVVPGSGLGLSAAKLVVDAHHGSLRASSTEGHGTTIEMRLPLLSIDVGEHEIGSQPHS